MLLSSIFLLLLFGVKFLKSSVIPKSENNALLRVKPAPTCMNRTYCETSSHYPTEIVLNALEKNPLLRDYINVDEMDVLPQVIDEPDEESLCVSTEQIIFPKLAISRSSEWRYIVNHEMYTQSVRIETCLEPDMPCRVIEGFAEGYYTTCKQKYIYRQLLAVTPNGVVSRLRYKFWSRYPYPGAIEESKPTQRHDWQFSKMLVELEEESK